MKVLIVDDNPVVRAGLRSVLSDLEEVDEVAEAGNGLEALKLLETQRCDMVFLDMRMPLLDGIATLESMKDVPVVMLTNSDDPELVREAMAKGAKGYLVYGEYTLDELVAAVRSCVRGGMVLSPPAVQAINAGSKRRDSSALAARYGISARESELLDALAEGLSNAQIAEKLYLSGKTVKNHLNRIYPKLGVSNRAEAIVLWLDRGY
ncbi:MAG: response regulator transcription factor [Propionibacteriaceae bacterium]|jgi:DNA-binding NarL/FixJ family response regulator|nr:response regulator transcription factor [Propionibacteriaceae bacterium]